MRGESAHFVLAGSPATVRILGMPSNSPASSVGVGASCFVIASSRRLGAEVIFVVLYVGSVAWSLVAQLAPYGLRRVIVETA